MAKDTTFEIRAGHGQQLGANYDGKGVNFALFSAHAERVELCLFDPSGKTEIHHRLPCTHATGKGG